MRYTLLGGGGKGEGTEGRYSSKYMDKTPEIVLSRRDEPGSSKSEKANGFLQRLFT